ncbi:serine/threonine-protein kinase RIO1 [Babesia gibsoni]|uniref:non-specific serine/threonine protein kinase n=1 Tax=Babesia gibsoni TaxID=33632 RepID=A0AAD8PE83_BABGI|nr:serine/threonine-protein kinase RIO1 [Babesia gibsoni]
MSDLDTVSEESSDSDESTLDCTSGKERKRDFLLPNFFFNTRGVDDKDAIRSTQIYKRNHYEKGLTKDKRTTVQQVLDKRTYIRLRKLCGQGVFHYMHGVISTGKEANVFEAETLPESQMSEFRKLIIAQTKGIASESDAENDLEEKIMAIALSHANGKDVSRIAHVTSSESEGKSEEANQSASNITSGSRPEDTEPDVKSDDCSRSRVAIKVYKTSILVFKDRSRYIEGEFRFRRAYSGTKNPRKMVAQWAEKEFRNLRRIALSGLYSPSPIALRDHVLVMDFVMHNNEVAPKLEHLGALPLVEWQTIYSQTIATMRVLFQECKLIHGDFSSFNMLYSEGKVYVIDTSQALENDHMNAMPFLKRDCENVTKFFEAVNVLQPNSNVETAYYDTLKMLTAEQLFCFIITRNPHFGDIDGQGEMSCLQEQLSEGDSLVHVRRFWEADVEVVKSEVLNSVEKMTKFNKFGTSSDMAEVITKKRLAYLDLCKAVYMFLTGSVFADEEKQKRIPWLMEVNFDKQLPLNMSQMPLDMAESVMGHSENVVLAINALSDHNTSDSDDEDEDDGDEVYTGDSCDEGMQEKEEEATPKFTGKIPEGIDPRTWKKMVKEHNRERRKHKIPKHIKKKYGNSKS